MHCELLECIWAGLGGCMMPCQQERSPACSGNFMDGSDYPGKGGARYKLHGGLCLEPQVWHGYCCVLLQWFVYLMQATASRCC